MNRFKLASWVAVLGCLAGGLMGQAAYAHGHGGGGHGGHSGGHMGGHSGGHYHGGGGGYYGGYGGFYGGGLGYYGSGYGYGYSSPYWYNRQGYYSPPVYATPQYIVSTVSTVPAPDGGEIVLFVAPDAPGAIQYTLNGQPYSLKPGETQRFTNDRVWTIEFAPTNNGQVALRYTLLSARYKFKTSGSGMGLFQTQDMPPVATTPVPNPVPNPPAN